MLYNGNRREARNLSAKALRNGEKDERQRRSRSERSGKRLESDRECKGTGRKKDCWRPDSFKSENIWTNPEPVITLGSEVRVYVDGNDFSKYYVDIQGVVQGRIVDYT